MPADQLQSLNVGVSNAPRYALYGTGIGAMFGLGVAGAAWAIDVYTFALHPDDGLFDGKQVVGSVALGAVTGAVGGAVLGSLSRRWEQRFARR